MRLPAGILLLLPLAGAEFVRIPAGEQTVRDAATGFQVRVHTGAFELGRTEVTQQDYARLMGANPSVHRGGDRPVHNVSWIEAVTYANRRSQREGLTPCYDPASLLRRPSCSGYRLPTSAEWAIAFDKPDPAAFRGGGYQDAAALAGREKAGPPAVAQGPPNAYGLYDMSGSVWEWCEDWYSPEPALDSVRDSQGPPSGLARVIRGGSYLTGGDKWNKALLSSLPPDRKGRFTGFRLARSISPAQPPAPPDDAFLARFQQVPPGATARPLPRTAEESRKLWLSVLGTPALPATAPKASPGREWRDVTWNARQFDLAIDPASPTRILVAAPIRKPAGRLPVLLVPYYDIDTPAGADLGGRRFTSGGTRAFARLAAQRGFLAVAIRWSGEADGEGYDEAVLQHTLRHPGVTPLGKWAFELQRVVDYLETRPDVDPARIGIIGHSLGGKMALYGAAFEPRIRAIVSSEPGIGLKFSNYGDFWYLGTAIGRLPADADHHELLALMAPRPFLLVGGESADGDKSWPYLLGAQKAYPRPEWVGMVNHRSGHSPSEESVLLAMEWLERFLR